MNPGHEKIRFSRRDLVNLGALPSARLHRPGVMHRVSGRAIGLIVSTAIAIVAILTILLVGVSLAVGTFGLGTERLTAEAQAAISRAVGRPMDTSIGAADVSFGRLGLISLDLRDVRISEKDSQQPAVVADHLYMSARLGPLFSGRVEIGSARLSGARIDLSALAAGDRDWQAALASVKEVVQPDAILKFAFSELNRLLDATEASGSLRFQIDDVTLKVGTQGPLSEIDIAYGRLVEQATGDVGFEAQISSAERTVNVDAEVRRTSRAARDLSLTAAIEMPSSGVPHVPADRPDPDAPAFVAGGFSGKIEASEAGLGDLRVDLGMTDMLVKTRNAEPIIGTARLRAQMQGGTGKIEISQLSMQSSQTHLNLNGAIGPLPAPAGGPDEPAYRFELVSRDAVLGPGDTSEQPLPVALSLSGRFLPSRLTIVGDQIAVGTDRGQVIGTGSVTLASGHSPAIALALGMTRLPTSYVKNIWPWFAAHGARQWAVANIFGGMVENGRISLNAPPGALDGHKQLGPNEISGHFEIKEARFDITGQIPPVRDAVGRIDFRGTDVDISLTSGKVYMSSSRQLMASNGTLTMRNAHLKPLIGNLEIDVEGDAAALAEFARYEPINVGRYIDLPPDDMTGRAGGRVSATIPLQKDMDRSLLRWKVDLSYEGVTLPKPFEGQKIADATGTLVADQDRAVVTAEAKINGVASKVSLVEPIGKDKSARALDVKLQIDDATRDALLPGLSEIVSGPFSVALSTPKPGEQHLEVDLARAKLTLPWIGWSKGAGVAATAQFNMRKNGDVTELGDFEIKSESFGAAGSLRLDKSGLAQARFSRVSLNRGDNATVAVERARGGWSVNVGGRQLDVRSIIRRYSKFTEGGGVSARNGGERVSVNAELDTVVGFNGELLGGLKLDVNATGDRIDTIRASAVTGNGARVTIVDATAGNQRKIEGQASDLGAVLRFLDVYKNLRGGTAALSLSGTAGGALRGPLDVRDFAILDEQRLDSMVNRAPTGSDRSLSQAANQQVDTSRTNFDRGYAILEKGEGSLALAEGVVRGPSVGATFQGTVFDQSSNMDITGTFMPAYGLNRLFGEIPLIGTILGNGRDRGLIGITFRMAGKSSDAKLSINPLSVVAPGIFRSIFEFR